jgi:hypothetical protein
MGGFLELFQKFENHGYILELFLKKLLSAMVMRSALIMVG